MTVKDNIYRTICRNCPEWIPYRYDGSLTLLRPDISVRPPGGGKDDWGGGWLKTNTDEGSYPDDTPVININEASSYKAPETDWEKVTFHLKKQVNTLSREDTLVIGYNELTLFERAQILLGTNNFLISTITEPENLETLLDIITDYQKQLTRSILESGCEGVRFTDDWGMQTSLFISPILWRRYIKPRMKILYDIVKEYKGLVFQHSCGNIEKIVQDLIEIGCDVLDPLQPAANDIFKLKEVFGNRLSFMGGLDTQSYLSFGSPEEVKHKVKKVLSIMGKDGGYIAAPSHTITIPAKNRLAMIDAIDEINRR